PEDLGELVDRELHLEEVLASGVAGLRALAGALPLLAVPLPHARAVLAVARAGDPDLVDRDGGHLLALPPHELTGGHVAPQVTPDPALDDVTEAAEVTVDVQHASARGPLDARMGSPRGVLLGGAGGEDAGDVLEHVARADLVV